MKEEEIRKLFHDVSELNRSNVVKNKGSKAKKAQLLKLSIKRLKILDCEEQFEDDFNEIHDTYDTGVYICAILSLMTSGGAILPCYGTLVTTTISRLLNAIYEYEYCVANQY